MFDKSLAIKSWGSEDEERAEVFLYARLTAGKTHTVLGLATQIFG